MVVGEIVVISRDACSVPDSATNTVVVTGGFWTMTTVSRYGREGYIEDLPSLNTGRKNHGCAGYRQQFGALVSWGRVLLVTASIYHL